MKIFRHKTKMKQKNNEETSSLTKSSQRGMVTHKRLRDEMSKVR